MSGNETDRESVHDNDDKTAEPQEDSGSEYQSEDTQIKDDASSTRSGSSNKSNRSLNTGSAKKRAAKRLVQSQIFKPPKATYSDAYRDFYNDHVEELAHPVLPRTNALPASELGVTVWSPLEKEILFQKVSTLGKDNIEAISEAVRTKSETEVRQYITILDQGTVEGNVTKTLPVFSAADVFSAYEVSKQSEELLEEYADGLAKYQLKGDQKREKKRHGDYWLLTEEIAEEVEEQVIARDGSYLKSKPNDEEGEEPEETEDSQNAPERDPERAKDEQDGSGLGIKDEHAIFSEDASRSQELDQQSAETAGELMVPAAELLDLPMWLRLSPLFMYQSPESGENWTEFVTSRHEMPSMYHTAFQDFHNLTVSLTRRLVQATIFQTMTRLRARDKDQPSTTITANDVRTATDILDLRPNMRRFWAGVPRRHGLRVYERGSKFSKGQSRAGAELSLEESEERMGVGKASIVDTEASTEASHTVECEMEEDVLDPDQYYEDSELWTEASENEDETSVALPEDQQSNESGEEAAYNPVGDEETQNAARTKQHRKGRMERNFQKVHDAYLEAVDQEISRVQEVEMWEALGLPPPNGIKDEEIEIPRQPVIKRRLSDTVNWRDGFEYQPPWERGVENVQPEDFAKMQKRGERAKKRRRLAYDYLEREGLATLPQKTSDVTVVRKKKPTYVDVEMENAPTEEAPIASTETLNDGVPRRKHSNPILGRVQSRASSVRQGSHDSSRSESSKPRNQGLANRLLNRAPVQQIESAAGRAEKEREAEDRLAAEKLRAKEQAKEEKREARAARRELSEEEKQAIARGEPEESKRNKRLERQEGKKRREKEEQQEKERLAKEEKRRAKEKKRKTKTPETQLGTGDDGVPEEEQELSREDVIIQEENVEEDDLDDVHQEVHAEQPKKTPRLTRSQGKKPKRKSGF